MQEHVLRGSRAMDEGPAGASEPFGFDDYRNLFQHYVQTVRGRARLLIVGALLAGLTTATITTVLLFTSPRYEATAIISVLPTESQIQFTQNWLGRSLIDPSTVGTITHLEQMHSRPVMERALDIVLESYAPEPSTGWRARARDFIQGITTGIWKTYEILNYGKFTEVNEREQQLRMLRSGIEITPMQASYILRIDASLAEPTLAAVAANAVAQAYAEETRAVSEQAAGKLKDFLLMRIAAKEAELDAATRQVARLEEAAEGAATGDAARFALEAVRAERASAQTELERLRAASADEPGSKAADALERNIALLETRIRDTEARQAWLEQNRDALLKTQRVMEGLAEALSQLRDRLLITDLSMTDGVSRVQMVDAARPPLSPASPKVLNYTLASMISGFLIAGVVIVVLDVFDDRIQTPAQLTRVTRGRSLGLLRRRTLQSARRRTARALAHDRDLAALTRRLWIEIDLKPYNSGSVHVVGLREAGAVTDDIAYALAIASDGLGRRLRIAEGSDDGDRATGGDIQTARVISHSGSAVAHLRSVRPGDDILLCLAPMGSVQQEEVARFAAEAEQRLDGGLLFALVEVR